MLSSLFALFQIIKANFLASLLVTLTSVTVLVASIIAINNNNGTGGNYGNGNCSAGYVFRNGSCRKA